MITRFAAISRCFPLWPDSQELVITQVFPLADCVIAQQISKSLSCVLRHRPDTVGLELEDGGWVRVADLLDAFERLGRALSLELLEVGCRHGKPVLLAINAKQIHADGYEFLLTENEIWLTDHVPPEYVSVVVD